MDQIEKKIRALWWEREYGTLSKSTWQIKGTNENFPSQFLWRHGGHVGGHENSSRKSSIALTTNMAPLSRGKPRI